MPEAEDNDYVLGTHREELARLGLQHQVWRQKAWDGWQGAGVTHGSKVVDVGCGPGFASMDLAELVGTEGRVVGIERSRRFADAAKAACSARNLQNVSIVNADLMDDFADPVGFDAAWCRWVACFVPSPERLVRNIHGFLRPGGRVVFHEYSHYSSWEMGPGKPAFDAFVQMVIDNWHEAGGEPNIALVLPQLLAANGFRIVSGKPLVFVTRPGDFVWQWPKAFITTNTDRLVELGRVSQEWADAVKKDFADAEASPATLMTTPLVVQIIAERD